MNNDRAITLENRLNQLQRGIQTTRKRRIEAYETFVTTLESKFVEYKVERDKTLEEFKNAVVSANKELALENRRLVQLETSINERLEAIRTRYQARQGLSMSSSIGGTKAVDFNNVENDIITRFEALKTELVDDERDYVSPRTRGLLSVLQKLIDIKETIDSLIAENEASSTVGDNGDAVIARMQQQLLPSIRRLSSDGEEDEKEMGMLIQKRIGQVQNLLEVEQGKRRECETTLMALLEKITQATLDADID